MSKHASSTRLSLSLSASHDATHLLLNLLVGGLLCLSLLLGDQAAEPVEGLVAHDEHGCDDGLASSHEASLLILLVLGGVDLEDVVLALEPLVVGEEDEALGVVVEIVGGLLDDGEALVDAVQRLVANLVGPGDVGGDVLDGLGEVGEDGSGEGLVGGVAELDGLLAVLVGLEGVDAVADEGVVQQVLSCHG